MRVITGSARGMALKAPKGMDTRPTMDQVKEGIFSAIQFEVEGRRVLDLFAGSGQMGIEALSRGAKSAVFVDMREDACKVVRENLAKTRLEQNARVVRADYLSYLVSARETFDLIFLDPPYAEVFLENGSKKRRCIRAGADCWEVWGNPGRPRRRERYSPDQTGQRGSRWPQIRQDHQTSGSS